MTKESVVVGKRGEMVMICAFDWWPCTNSTRTRQSPEKKDFRNMVKIIGRVKVVVVYDFTLLL